jgi:hypothetical protein
MLRVRRSRLVATNKRAGLTVQRETLRRDSIAGFSQEFDWRVFGIRSQIFGKILAPHRPVADSSTCVITPRMIVTALPAVKPNGCRRPGRGGRFGLACVSHNPLRFGRLSRMGEMRAVQRHERIWLWRPACGNLIDRRE